MKNQLLLILFLIGANAYGQFYSFPPAPDASKDAFSRTRVSTPANIFESQFTYGFTSLLYDTSVVGTGASIAWDDTNKIMEFVFSSTPTGGSVIMQTYESFHYQPLKSQLVAITFNMNGGAANTTKFVGYGDGDDGFEFIVEDGTPKVRILTSTAAGNQTISQSSWNINKLNWETGDTLDLTKCHILVIDFQALYVGRVRFGFDLDGDIVYVHEFKNAGNLAYPYISNANLPLRYGMTCSGTSTTTMNVICAGVVSEGGQEDVAGFSFSESTSLTAGNGTATHAISIQPDSLFNGKTNRVRFEIESVDIVVTGNSPVEWQLVIGQGLSGTTAFSEVNSTYSAMDYNTAGTLAGSPLIVVARGYVAASAQVKTAVKQLIKSRYPMGIGLDNLPSISSRYTLIVTGIGGTPDTRATINWKEIR